MPPHLVFSGHTLSFPLQDARFRRYYRSIPRFLLPKGQLAHASRRFGIGLCAPSFRCTVSGLRFLRFYTFIARHSFHAFAAPSFVLVALRVSAHVRFVSDRFRLDRSFFGFPRTSTCACATPRCVGRSSLQVMTPSAAHPHTTRAAPRTRVPCL